LIGPHRRLFFHALCALALASTGCSRPAKGSGLRVVSLTPSTTEAIFAMHAEDVLVGRSMHCDFPEGARVLPSVGGYANPNLEAIVALRPTLVVGARGPAGPSFERRLVDLGIDTLFPETESIEQIEGMLRGLGEHLGRAKEAQDLVRAMQADCKAAETEASEHPKAVFVFDLGPIVVAGPGSFPAEVMHRAGAVNLISGGGAYPTIGIEHLVALDPDVIIDGASAAHGSGVGVAFDGVREKPGFRDLRAIREGRVVSIASDALRPGPRICQGALSLAQALRKLYAPGRQEPRP
jgi:iron complex transport system substrate-binding protein